MIDHLHWHPSNRHVTSPSPEKLISIMIVYSMMTKIVLTIMVFLMLVNLMLMLMMALLMMMLMMMMMDLNIASNFELVSCSARGAGGNAREAP